MTEEQKRQNSAASFQLAVDELRRMWLEQRHPGESAKDWHRRVYG
jgi:hypothetical protein